MQYRYAFVLATIVAFITMVQSYAGAQSLKIDNFEEYTNGTVVAPTTKAPWFEFGAADADRLTATTSASKVLDGSVSGVTALAYTGSATYAVAAYNYDYEITGTAQNFSGYSNGNATILAKSDASTAITQLQLIFTDGTSTFLSSVPQAITTTSATYTFALLASAFTETAGSESFATTLSNTEYIGVQFTDAAGSSGSDSVSLDDFQLQSVPEPASAALICFGVGSMLLRRPRGKFCENARRDRID